MNLPHARPHSAFVARLMALAATFHGGTDDMPLPVAVTGEKHTSHGGLQAFNFDRRRAHLRRMKYRRGSTPRA